MKTVNWLESEITQTASEIRGLLSSSDILYWFVWEEGLLLGGKTKQRRADNTVRDPSVFVWEAGLLNTWGTELNKKLNLFLLLFVDSQKDACFCCCCAWDEEVSKMTVENVFKKQKQVLLTPQSPYRLLSRHNSITRWIISLQIQVWWQSLLRKWTVLLKNCPINWLGSGPEIKKILFFFFYSPACWKNWTWKNNSICFVQVQFWQLSNVYYILLNCFYPSLPLFNHSLLFILTLYLVQFTSAWFIVHCVGFHLVLWWMNNSALCVLPLFIWQSVETSGGERAAALHWFPLSIRFIHPGAMKRRTRSLTDTGNEQEDTTGIVLTESRSCGYCISN